MSPLRRLVHIRAGGQVERCHGFRHFGTYQNSQHQWGVAMIMWTLWPEDFPRLGIHCLVHDVPEQWVGDIPANFKAAAPPELRIFEKMVERRILSDLGLPQDDSLSALDIQKIKNCDSLELYMWCQEQILLYGVHPVSEIIDQLDSFYNKSGKVQLLPEARALYDELKLVPVHILRPRVAGVVETIAEGGTWR
jgi:5'-deoxynucleotidase YfbR-like HD superfamily hydrolase